MENCSQCGLDAQSKRCGRCGKIAYCSEECQLAHWNAGHRRECKKKKKKKKKKKTKHSSDDEEGGSLFTGMDALTARRLEKRKRNPRSEHCAGCGKGITDATRREFKKCGGCMSVWYCSKDCQARHWNEPPWGAARGVEVPEGRSSDANMIATTDGQGHSIVNHRTVCPLLQEAYEEEAKHEAKMVAGGEEERTADAYFRLAIGAAQRGQVEKAIAAYREAINVDPEHALAYCNLGIVLKAKGDLEAAVDAYNQAIRIKPDFAQAYYALGTALKTKGDLDGAIDAFNQAIRINPEYALAYYGLGIVFKAKGDLDAAINAFNQAIRINPEHAKAREMISLVREMNAKQLG
jgi:tetratricopeptide (TPR) repeat protein